MLFLGSKLHCNWCLVRFLISKESFWFLEPAQFGHNMFMSFDFHMEGLFLEVHAISLKAELQKVFQERFFNAICTSTLICFLFLGINISYFLEQAIRALISKGAGSASYTGSCWVCLVCRNYLVRLIFLDLETLSEFSFRSYQTVSIG